MFSWAYEWHLFFGWLSIWQIKWNCFSSFYLKRSSLLKLVCSNVSSPTHVLSRERFRCHIHFFDDYSRFSWVIPLRLKSECKIVFMQFHKILNRQFDKKKLGQLSVTREVSLRVLTPYLQYYDMSLRHACLYVDQQNGRIGRKHKHIVELLDNNLIINRQCVCVNKVCSVY